MRAGFSREDEQRLQRCRHLCVVIPVFDPGEAKQGIDDDQDRLPFLDRNPHLLQCIDGCRGGWSFFRHGIGFGNDDSFVGKLGFCIDERAGALRLLR